MTLTSAPATLPDLLRLVAIPVLAWAAVRDVETRRVPSTVWIPLTALAAILLVWDARVAAEAGGLTWTREFLIPAAISLGFVVPLAYLFWWFGGFGGADAKALMVLALLFPTVPTYVLGSATLPVAGVVEGMPLALAVLTNAALVGLVLPLVLALGNAAAGRIAPVMFVGWPIGWDRVPETHGRLLQTPDGLTRRGLDLDALRMYLRWRGLTLAAIRDDPDHYRDPMTLPDVPNPPTDGAIHASEPRSDGGETAEGSTAVGPDELARSSVDEGDEPDSLTDDPWGAEAFIDDVDGSAYGTAPGQLRDGLDVLCAEETVWVSPGAPFLVPVFLGLVIALVYGDPVTPWLL